MNPQPLAISEVVARALDLVPRPAGVQVDVVSLAGIQVMGDASLLRQAFVNLVQNAVEACGDTGRVTVEGRMVDGKVEISVEDTGHGLDASVKARLFEPLITTKARGVGLGLALVKRIVDEAGGRVTVDSALGRGATFRFTWPKPRPVGAVT
jgi:signal transduction histidine kinase